MLGLSVPAMAQNANYNEMLKPIAQSLKATPNMDAKALKNLIKDYQKDFKKDPKALVALGETLLMNKQYDEATNIANNVISKYKDCGNAYILLGDIAAMKEHYQRGGLGDVKTKRYLLEILERELGPIRERRVEFAKDMGQVYQMLKEGCDKARQTAAQTLSEVKSAMGINYFK